MSAKAKMLAILEEAEWMHFDNGNIVVRAEKADRKKFAVPGRYSKVGGNWYKAKGQKIFPASAILHQILELARL